MSTLVVTGASGFVGRRLLELLHAEGHSLVAVGRSAAPAALPSGVRWLTADLLDADGYEQALRGAAAVFHLAATTGKAPKRDYLRNNVEATRTLVGACERAGVSRFLQVSSIAARFEDRRYYPYADSKLAAEELVLRSSLETTIVRPTMVFGEGSPVQSGLERLARLPIVPVFGDGATPVQPVDVRELVRFVAAVAVEPEAAGQVIELGGPEVCSIEELLLGLRRAQGGTSLARVIHLPVHALRHLLAAFEALGLLSLLPLTAGQLASFVNAGSARPHPLVQKLLPIRIESPAATSTASRRSK